MSILNAGASYVTERQMRCGIGRTMVAGHASRSGGHIAAATFSGPGDGRGRLEHRSIVDKIHAHADRRHCGHRLSGFTVGVISDNLSIFNLNILRGDPISKKNGVSSPCTARSIDRCRYVIESSTAAGILHKDESCICPAIVIQISARRLPKRSCSDFRCRSGCGFYFRFAVGQSNQLPVNGIGRVQRVEDAWLTLIFKDRIHHDDRNDRNRHRNPYFLVHSISIP